MSSIHRLRVYHHAKTACARAYAIAGGIPDASLRDQMRRAATSVVLNISELTLKNPSRQNYPSAI